MNSPLSRRGVCALFLAASCLASPFVLRADDHHPRTENSAVTAFNRNPKRHDEFLARKKQGPIDLLFLGDSITDWWPSRGPDTWAKFAAYHPADFAVAGETTDDVLWRITNGELDGLHPKLVVLMLGTNNVGQHPEEKPAWVIGGLRKVIDVIHERLPDAKLLLLAIFPRDGKESSNRQRNEAINAELPKLADGDQTHFLNINQVFLNEDGEIPGDVMPDKLHPNAKGYQLWYDAMLPTLTEMMK